MYFSKSFEFVRFSFLPISCCSLFVSSVSCNLHIIDVNKISWYCILHSVKYLVNHIVSVFQFTSRLYLTNQLYPKIMSVPFKSMTAMSILSIYPFISSSNSANLVISLFLVSFALKTLNNVLNHNSFPFNALILLYTEVHCTIFTLNL